jgi:biopolymer transport protein ExbB/TolQ
MDFSLLGLWHQMGTVARAVVILLLSMSVYAIGIALDRIWTFTRGRRRSVAYIEALAPLLSLRPRDALGLEGQWKDAPVARIIGPGLAAFFRGLDRLGAHAADAVELELLAHDVGRLMDRARKRELAQLQRGLPALATIASSSPFVGLFGTVFGIITAFQQMADPSKGGGGGLASVSAGISEALLTTAVGLGVAIGSLWFYNFFVAKLDGFAGLAEEVAGDLIDTIVRDQRDVRRAESPPTPFAANTSPSRAV